MNIDLTADAEAEQLDIKGGRSDATVSVQNAGPGDVYLGRDADVDETTGLKIEPDAAPVSVVVAGGVFAFATGGDADVRYL